MKEIDITVCKFMFMKARMHEVSTDCGVRHPNSKEQEADASMVCDMSWCYTEFPEDIMMI